MFGFFSKLGAKAHSDALSEHFNSQRSFVALLGGVMISSGVNMFKTDRPLLGAATGAGDSADGLDKNQQIATLLFSLGWLVIALSIVYEHTANPGGIIQEPLSARTFLAFASAIAVVAGASMARAEYDADPLASNVSSLAQTLFLGGWAGITLAMVASSLSPLKWVSGTKMCLVLLGVATTLAGVMQTRAFELESAIEFAGGDYSSAVETSRHMPKILFIVGWAVIAAGIGYEN